MARRHFVEDLPWNSFIIRLSTPSVVEDDGAITIDNDPGGARDYHYREGGGHKIKIKFDNDDPPSISFKKDDGKHQRNGVRKGYAILGFGKTPTKRGPRTDEDVIWVATKGGGGLIQALESEPLIEAERKTSRTADKKKGSKK